MGIICTSLDKVAYLGITIGGQLRAGLIRMSFSKSLRISGSAQARGTTNRNTLSDATNPVKEQERTREKDAKNKEDGEGGGWSNGKVVNLMGWDSYRVDQA